MPQAFEKHINEVFKNRASAIKVGGVNKVS